MNHPTNAGPTSHWRGAVLLLPLALYAQAAAAQSTWSPATCPANWNAQQCTTYQSLGTVPPTCSTRWDQPQLLEFTNSADSRITVDWLSYRTSQCATRRYATLAPDEAYTQRTYVTHPWVLSDAQTGSIFTVAPQSQQTAVVYRGAASGFQWAGSGCVGTEPPTLTVLEVGEDQVQIQLSAPNLVADGAASRRATRQACQVTFDPTIVSIGEAWTLSHFAINAQTTGPSQAPEATLQATVYVQGTTGPKASAEWLANQGRIVPSIDNGPISLSVSGNRALNIKVAASVAHQSGMHVEGVKLSLTFVK